MTKAEALAKIENIEGMTGSRAVALVDALDALGLLNIAIERPDEKVLKVASGFREIKDSIPVMNFDALAKVNPEGSSIPPRKYE